MKNNRVFLTYVKWSDGSVSGLDRNTRPIELTEEIQENPYKENAFLSLSLKQTTAWTSSNARQRVVKQEGKRGWGFRSRMKLVDLVTWRWWRFDCLFSTTKWKEILKVKGRGAMNGFGLSFSQPDRSLGTFDNSTAQLKSLCRGQIDFIQDNPIALSRRLKKRREILENTDIRSEN